MYEIGEDGVALSTAGGKFEIWTLYITYVLCAIVGAYIVFGSVKLHSVMFPAAKTSSKNDRKNKNK